MEMKNDEIRISTDAMIALVVTEAEERELAKMPSLQEMNEAFHPSDQFLKKMDKLLRTAKNKQRMRQWRRVAKRTVVSFTVLVTLFTCMMMPAKAVQKAVVTTMIEWHDKFMSVVFSSDTSTNRTLPEEIELGYIPEGFTVQNLIEQNEDSFAAEYINDKLEYFTLRIVSLENQPMIAMDNEQTKFYSIQFDSHDAIWGSLEEGKNTLTWSENGFVYQISGILDLNTLIKIAENMKI